MLNLELVDHCKKGFPYTGEPYGASLDEDGQLICRGCWEVIEPVKPC